MINNLCRILVHDQQIHWDETANTEELITKQTKEDNFGIVPRNKFANLTLWQKGIKTINDFDNDIMQKYKEGKITKEAMEKMGFSV